MDLTAEARKCPPPTPPPEIRPFLHTSTKYSAYAENKSFPAGFGNLFRSIIQCTRKLGVQFVPEREALTNQNPSAVKTCEMFGEIIYF